MGIFAIIPLPPKDYNILYTLPCKAEYFWPLSSGRLVVISPVENNNFELTVWNQTELIYSESFRNSPNIFKNLSTFLLPESAFLTQLKDTTFHLSKEQEFIHRALVQNPENFAEKHKNFLTSLMNKCFYLEENIFAVPERKDANLHDQLSLTVYQQEKTPDGISIKVLSTNNFLCYIPKTQDEVNCFTLDAHTIAISGSYSLLPLVRFPFKFDGTNVHFEKPTSDFFNNNYGNFFPLNKYEVVLINKEERFQFWTGGLDYGMSDREFSFRHLYYKCESLSSTFIPRDLSLEWVSKTPQHYFMGNHNFLFYECSRDASPTTSAKSNLLIYNTFDNSVEVVDLPFDRTKIEVSAEGHVITIKDGYIQIAEFPKVTAWLKHLNKTLRSTLEEIFDEKALCNLVSDYVEKDIQPNRFYGNFFNTKNEINSQPTGAPRLG